MSKIAVVGCQSSGKTVFMAALSDYFRAGQRSDQSSWLIPENSDAHKFTERRNYEMRVQHVWPDATLENPTSLKWSLRQKNGARTDIEMLEFSGEVFRAAFREEGSSPQHKDAAEKLVSYLIDADFIVVLVGLNELYRSHDEDRQIFEDDIESVWVTRGLIDFVKKNMPPETGLVIALTQADLYKAELDKLGGAANVLKARWPMISAAYPDVPVVAVASVSKTTADGRPAEDYTTEGVLPVMKVYSEFVYGNPADLIAEMDVLAEELQDMKKACPLEVLEHKLAKHRQLFEELGKKVTIVDALYDDIISRHANINNAAAGLLEALRPILYKDIEELQDAKTWDDLRAQFPAAIGTINAYEVESRDQYKAMLANQAKQAAAEKKAREEEARRREETAKRDEERRRQLELEERERQAEAERVRIEKEKASVKSRSFMIRAVAILVVLCGAAWGVKSYLTAEKKRIESENAVKLAEVRKAEFLQKEQEAKNKAAELARQQLEEENKKREMELRQQQEKQRRIDEENERKRKDAERVAKQKEEELKRLELEAKKLEAEKAIEEAKARQREIESARAAELEAINKISADFKAFSVRFARAVKMVSIVDAERIIQEIEDADMVEKLSDKDRRSFAKMCEQLGQMYENSRTLLRSEKKAQRYYDYADSLLKR